jgi:hypothetical protein
LVLLSFSPKNYSATDGISVCCIGSTIILKEIVCALSHTDALGSQVILKFGNGLSYSLSPESPLPANVLNGERIALDIELSESSSQEVIMAKALFVLDTLLPPCGQAKASTAGLQLSVAPAVKQLTLSQAGQKLTLAQAGQKLTMAPSAGQPNLSVTAAVASNSATGLQIVSAVKGTKKPGLKDVLDKSAYFCLIAYVIEQVLGSPSIQLQALYDSLIASAAAAATSTTAMATLLRAASLPAFKTFLQSEPVLFVLSRKNRVHLQPAGPAFIERYLTLCPGVLVAKPSTLSLIDAMLPVSGAPQHMPGAYQQLNVLTLLRVKQKKWRALFTFQSNQNVIFYIPVNKPRKASKVVSTSNISSRILACQISIGTKGWSGQLFLTYQFLDDNLPASVGQQTPTAKPGMAKLNTPAQKTTQPDLISHLTAGKFLLSFFYYISFHT